MTSQSAWFLGLVLVCVIHDPPVLADLSVDPSLHSKNFLYQLRSLPLQDAALDTYNVSSQCKAEIHRLLYGDPKTLETDAIMALDAFGKPQAGFLQANWAWLGHYDECMALEGFNYCFVDMALNTTMLMPPKNQSQSASLSTMMSSLGAFKTISIRWGICPPTNCSEEDIHGVLKELLDALKILDGIITTEALTSDGAICTAKPPIPYSAGFICTVIICVLIASLMVIGALYDEYLQLQAKKPPRPRRTSKTRFSRPWRLLDDKDEADEDSDDEPLLDNGGAPELLLNGDTNSNSSPKKQSLAVRLLLCFALNRNLAKLMDVKQGDASIGALNGIRVISMFWVILGHTLALPLGFGITENFLTIADWVENHWGFQAVANAFFSVDSFFFLSGFLLAYLTFSRFRELTTAKRWALFYFHRYWRLTPLLCFTILIWMYIPQFFGDGPVWQLWAQRPYCPKYWWTNLLYINNFWPVSFGEECIGWTWYLANDMQFFIISPLLMVPLFYYPVFGWLGLFATLVASFISTGLIISSYDLHLNLLGGFLNEGADYSSLVYSKPYCRIAPYLVGIGLGYIMHRIGKRKVRMSPVLAVIGWLVAAAMATSVLYGLYPSYQTPMTMAARIVYGSVSRFVWALALAWVVFACKYGYGGWINTFLSWGAWVPLARITFSAYMIHPIVIDVFYFNFGTPWHFSIYLMAFYFAGFVAISYFIAIFLALAIEYPFANLEKLLLQPPPRVKKIDENGGEATEKGMAD